MVLKGIFAAVLGIGVLAWNGASMADEYRADEFLRLDLPQAALSPKRLGPPTQFEPVAVEAKAEAKKAEAKPDTKVDPVVKVAPVRTVKRHSPVPNRAAPTRQARRHTNPLDAQAFDTRIQVWPCRSGGICNWQR
jgi:hypothetical protein